MIGTGLVWAFCVVLSVIGIVGYDVAVKYGTISSNAFSFMAALACLASVMHLLVLGVYKATHAQAALSISPTAWVFLFFAALGLLSVDFSFFYAVKLGGLVKTNAVWLIGGLLVTTFIGSVFFKEPLDAYKIIGVILGIASILFIAR